MRHTPLQERFLGLIAKLTAGEANPNTWASMLRSGGVWEADLVPSALLALADLLTGLPTSGSTCGSGELAVVPDAMWAREGECAFCDHNRAKAAERRRSGG